MAEPSSPIIIYTVVPCPACGATALRPCTEEGVISGDDVHLMRYELFASARFSNPERGLKYLMALQNSEYQGPKG